MIDMENIPLDDQKTWDMICDGRVKGCFQIESNLGRTWCKKVKPRSIQELSDVIALIRPGCVSGDTLIHVKNTYVRNTKYAQKIQMRDVFKNKDKYKEILSYNENGGSLVNNKVADIVYSGEKECFKVKVARYCRKGVRKNTSHKSYNLECTSDHKLLTPDGWKELKDIKVNERVAVLKKNMNKTFKEKAASRFHPGVLVNNAKNAHYFAEICYQCYRQECIFCDWNLASLDINHLEGNRYTDNSPENLCFMCPNHHRMYTEGFISKEEVIKARESKKLPISERAIWGTFLGAESVGIKDTYDISMEAPHHNFIAGNVVVHNCLQFIYDGKSMAQHYADRKAKIDKPVALHPILEDVLKDTYGVLCIHEDTLVSMSDGRELEIKNLSRGDSVNSVCQKTFKINEEKVHDIKISPKTDGVELTLTNGWSVILTDDHKVFTLRGAVEVRDLQEGDVVQFVLNQPQKPSSALPIFSGDKWYYLCGQLLGDGCAGYAIASGTERNSDILFDYLVNNFSDELNIKRYFNVRSHYISLSGIDLLNNHEFGNRKTKYRRFLEILGLDKTGMSKLVPNEIMMSEPDGRHRFLAGLFDSDGYVSSKEDSTATIHLCSANKKMLHQIRKLLTLDGIHCFIASDGLHLHVLNTERFKELINPHMILKKITTRTSNGFKTGAYPRQMLKKHIEDCGFSINEVPVNFGVSKQALTKKGFASYGTANKIGFNTGDVITYRVKSIKPVKNQVFYSISITGHHNLIGNGIVISNCFQEQIMKIASTIAGFNPKETDALRKSVGKKDAKKLFALQEQFVAGCVNTSGLKKEEADLIFENIKKSARYLFNLSHSVSYAYEAYWSAYLKCNYLEKYYKHWLRGADEKMEKRQLIMSARAEGVDVKGPHYSDLEEDFFWDGSAICFGICNIKGIGKAHLTELREQFNVLEKDNWVNILFRVTPNVSKTAIENMIMCGAFSGLGKTRTEMLHEYKCISDLTDKEIQAIVSTINLEGDTKDVISKFLSLGTKKNGGLISTESRLKKVHDILSRLENPGRSMVDNPDIYAKAEEKLIAYPINISQLSGCSEAAHANATCKEIEDGKMGHSTLAVIVTKFREYKTKKDEIMCFLSAEDESGEIENIVIFPDVYSQFKDIIYEKATILISGEVKDKERKSFIVERIFQI